MKDDKDVILGAEVGLYLESKAFGFLSKIAPTDDSLTMSLFGRFSQVVHRHDDEHSSRAEKLLQYL